MPTYDYRCKACSHTWEALESIKAEPTKKCPECGKAKAERVIGPGAGILFKGTGFYITDYRSEGYKKAAKAEGGSEGSKSDGGGKSDGAKSEGGKSEGGKSESGKSEAGKSEPKPAKAEKKGSKE